MNSLLKGIALFSGVFLLFAGCAKAPVRCADPGDTPESHYQGAMELLADGRLQEASSKFERASFCDESYSPAISGAALALALRTKNAADSGHKKADIDKVRAGLKAAKKSMKTNEDEFAYYLASMRIDTALKGEEWLEEVEDSYKDARKIKANEEKLLYYKTPEAADYFMGMAFLEARELRKASESFAAVLNARATGRWHAPSDKAWKRADRTLRALEGASLGEAGRRIALLDTVTRADMAALLVRELKIEELFSGKTLSKAGGEEFVPSDLASSPFREEAAALVRLNVRGLEASYDAPSRAYLFRPTAPVKRKELAMALEDVLIRITGDEGASSAFLGHKASPFPDIEPSSAWYNAVMSVTTRSIMETEVSGEFRPEEAVDGAEAVTAVRALKFRLNIE